MYNLKMEERSIKELLEGVKGGSIIREGLQRTPSHDLKKSSEILTAIMCGKYAGVLHFSKLEGGELSILDGSSRLQDFDDFMNGKEGVVVKLPRVNTEGEQELTKLTYNQLTNTEKEAFNNYKLPCIILNGVNNSETFVSLNNSTSLSVIQKCKGNLSEELQDVIKLITDSAIIKNCLSNRQLQKDEGVVVSFQILANIYGCYSATNKKLVESVKATNLTNFDFERLTSVLSKFYMIDCDINKYCIISLVSALYNSALTNEDIEGIEPFTNNIVYKVDTTGANSAPQNEARLKKATKKLNEALGINIKTGKALKTSTTSQGEAVEVEEVAGDNTEELLNIIG